MPGDVMLARLSNEIEHQRTLQETLVEEATKNGRDLTDSEMEMFNRANTRMSEIESQLEPMRKAAEITASSRDRLAAIQSAIGDRTSGSPKPQVEYRSAGQYVMDILRKQLGDDDARGRIEYANRVAAHQTTADVPGLLPEQIVAPLVNRVDMARPIVGMIGPTDLGGGAWAYAKVTQHTSVTAQSAEKAELASQEMLVTKTSITPVTYGGYVNISKQAINRTTPQILDMVVADLAAQYAIATENVAADDLTSGATAGTNTAITGSSDADDINAALWSVAATAYTNMKGAGRLFLAVSPDLLGTFGKVFLPVNPTGTASTGFNAGEFGSGVMGSISGIPLVMSAGLNTNTALLINTAAVRIFEYRYGQLQVVEPSVWGVQVGYAGDFETVITDAGGVIQVDTTA